MSFLRDPHKQMCADQDVLLIRMSEPHPTFNMATCRKLPPWRAVLLARVGYNMGLVSRTDLDALIAEAQAVGGNGTLRQQETV